MTAMTTLGEGYYVLVDVDGREASNRAPGTATLTMQGQQVTLSLEPFDTNEAGEVELVPHGPGLHYLGIGLTETGVVHTGPAYDLRAGMTVFLREMPSG